MVDLRFAPPRPRHSRRDGFGANKCHDVTQIDIGLQERINDHMLCSLKVMAKGPHSESSVCKWFANIDATGDRLPERTNEMIQIKCRIKMHHLVLLPMLLPVQTSTCLTPPSGIVSGLAKKSNSTSTTCWPQLSNRRQWSVARDDCVMSGVHLAVSYDP